MPASASRQAPCSGAGLLTAPVQWPVRGQPAQGNGHAAAGGQRPRRARRPCDAARAKYALQHTVRTHLACEDAAYGCMGAGQDAQGLSGVFLRKNVIETASRALAENLRVLTPLVTPPIARVRPARAAWRLQQVRVATGQGSRSCPVWLRRPLALPVGPGACLRAGLLGCRTRPAAHACPPPALRARCPPRHDLPHVAHAGRQGRDCLPPSQPCQLHASARGGRTPDPWVPEPHGGKHRVAPTARSGRQAAGPGHRRRLEPVARVRALPVAHGRARHPGRAREGAGPRA